MLVVDAVDQRGQGRRLARSGSACDQDDSIANLGRLLQLRRQTKRTESWNDRGNYAHDNRATAALDKNVHAKARHSRQAVRNVAGTLLAKRGQSLFVGANEISGDAASVVRRKYAAALDFNRRELSVNFYLRRTARRKNQIADLLGRAQHAGQKRRGRNRAGSADAFKRDRDRGIPRSSHAIHSQLSVLHHRGEAFAAGETYVLNVTRTRRRAKDR